jgi:hypothetical protein
VTRAPSFGSVFLRAQENEQLLKGMGIAEGCNKKTPGGKSPGRFNQFLQAAPSQ